MSAFLAVAYVFVVARPDHNAVVFLGRVAEQFYSAHRNFAKLCYRLLRVDGSLVKDRTNEDPDIPHEHTKAGQHEEFGELPTRDVALVRGANRELFFPKWFVTPAPQPVHVAPPTCSPQHPKRWPHVRLEPS